MGIKQQQGLKISLRTKLVIIATASAGAGLMLFLFFFGYFNTAIKQEAKATTLETLSTGSFIINMGVTPQTIGNGLKPYGLIYDLITNYNVPVKWVIEPTKIKDGADFTHNGITYKGGTFIIPAEFISANATTCINNWIAQGVVGNYTVSGITVPVYDEIKSFPRILIDDLANNDTIITNYCDNAGLPDSAYDVGTPADLTTCHDMWVNPHGDPVWATHGPLYDFVTVEKSYIWSQCHAVSMLEWCSDPLDPTKKLNYLSTTGLKCYMSGKCGTNPEYHAKNPPAGITYFHPTDPVMQFMGTMSSVCGNGSEKWFIPISTGGWRTSTKVLVKVGSNASPNEGVFMVYGHAFGDSTNGRVMYTGGHDMNGGSSSDNVSAQRSFFNFLLLAGKAKAPAMTGNINSNINANATDTFSVSVTGGTAPYSYSWQSSLGGTFSNPNDSVTAFTAFHTMLPAQTIITCVITDACGRRNFITQPLLVNASALPISLVSFTGHYLPDGTVGLKWKTASEINNNYFTISKSSDGNTFTSWKDVPSQGNSSTMQEYSLIDNSPLQGISYYKLHQTDDDGTRVELGIIKVQKSGKSPVKSLVTAGPNPFIDRLTINIFSEHEDTATLRMWNVSGKKVFEKSFFIDEGDNQLTVGSLEKLPKGAYLLRVFNGEVNSDGIKLIKK